VHPLGRYAIVRGMVASLANRLRLQRLTHTRPAIFDRPVPEPLIIVGLPRSGTTVLHRLIAQDPGRRSAPFWEVNFPLARDEAGSDSKSDPRPKSGAAAIRAMYWIAPQMRQMHEVQNDAAEEEIQLLTMGFCSAFYHTVACSPPRFTAWYTRADHVPGYRLFKRTLQAMQWSRPGPDRWVLKTPSHLHICARCGRCSRMRRWCRPTATRSPRSSPRPTWSPTCTAATMRILIRPRWRTRSPRSSRTRCGPPAGFVSHPTYTSSTCTITRF
jgi:hypothetical protein